MYFPQVYVYLKKDSTNSTALPQRLNTPKMFDGNSSNLKKLALRTSMALLLLFIFSCLLVVATSLFNTSTRGELTSQDTYGELVSQERSNTVQDIFLILFILTLGHFIIDFISPDHEDRILRQVDRMGTWIIGFIALRYKELDALYSHFRSAKALSISVINICKRLWHHTKCIMSCLHTIISSMLSTIYGGWSFGFKVLTCLSPKVVFWVIMEIVQVMLISLYSNLQLLYQCTIKLVEKQVQLLTNNKLPPIAAGGATNNIEFKKPPTPTETHSSEVKTIAIPTNAKVAVPGGKTLLGLIKESRAVDELESRDQIEEEKLEELEAAKWKQLDKLNQMADLAMEMVWQRRAVDELESRDQIEEEKLEELEAAKWKQLDKLNQMADLAMEMVWQSRVISVPLGTE
ncbi:hypothetical protein L211DRAFT_894012 [Terfezia boudieri ATCC MYA-4762]|uniref:Uncharacterized protein n=1 Tax=Terfezia boudieri ATCC MYA-4762 TaxID=1051890 RepID=A0A3N4M1Q3_9PEZI|nr:hypothetical protein L211DRAFT_894012 [Terfezia boudieri ATCC MYA-4762]